jgi:hypothetical protein
MEKLGLYHVWEQVYAEYTGELGAVHIFYDDLGTLRKFPERGDLFGFYFQHIFR